ncbi:hypothetical protein [Syntrophomonas curvata]
MFVGKLPDILINIGCGLILMVVSFAVGKLLSSREHLNDYSVISVDNRFIEKHHHDHYHSYNYYQAAPVPIQQTSQPQDNGGLFVFLLFIVALLITLAIFYIKYGQYFIYTGYLISFMFLCINSSMIWFSIKNNRYALLEPQLKGLAFTLTVLWVLLFVIFFSGAHPYYIPDGVPELMSRLKPLPIFESFKAAGEYGSKPELYFFSFQAVGLIAAMLSTVFLLGCQLLCLKSWGSGRIVTTSSSKIIRFFSGLWNKNGKWTAFTIFILVLVPSFLLLSGIFHHWISWLSQYGYMKYS